MVVSPLVGSPGLLPLRLERAGRKGTGFDFGNKKALVQRDESCLPWYHPTCPPEGGPLLGRVTTATSERATRSLPCPGQVRGETFRLLSSGASSASWGHRLAPNRRLSGTRGPLTTPHQCLLLLSKLEYHFLVLLSILGTGTTTLFIGFPGRKGPRVNDLRDGTSAPQGGAPRPSEAQAGQRPAPDSSRSSRLVPEAGPGRGFRSS